MDIKDQTVKRIQQKVDSGEFSDENEVLERALDALDEAEISDAELRRLLQPALEQLDRGESIPAEKVFARLQAEHDRRVRQTGG